MTLFLSDEEYARCSHDPSLIAQKADAYIRELYNQLETEKAQYDASSITAEQTCSILEQKYVSLKSEFSALQSQHSQLNSTLEERVSELAQIQADKHQIYLQSIGKDGEIERLSKEVSEFHKSKSQLLQIIEHKDLELNEKNTSIKGYLEKIVSLTDNISSKESRTRELEAELARVHTSLAKLSQEKELVERHNIWLNDELTTKVNNLLELRKSHNELEADMSSKLSDLERKYNDTCNSLKFKDERVKELESKLESLQQELCSCKDSSASTEERLSAELATVNKLVELYKENSGEWSKKAGELEGVIKALETHSSQVEKDYKEKLEKETTARKGYESEVSNLKEKVKNLEAEVESSRKTDEFSLLQMTTYNPKQITDNENNNSMIVPSIPAGISGTALAASLLRDGWSLAKMYEKYQEAIDALRHEQLGRKQSQSILERVYHEIEEKAEMILDERAEHERMLEAYDTLNEKLQNSLSEQTTLERNIQELKAELKRHERDYNLSQMENKDLQKQVTVLLKECRDIQLRCGSGNYDSAIDDISDELALTERLLTFKDINGLVEQNVQLRGLVRLLTEQIESKEAELKEEFEKEFRKHNEETARKVDAVLSRAEEQSGMIESLHTSVAMYKKLYEEEHKRNLPLLESQSHDTESLERNRNVTFLLEGSNDASKRANDRAYEKIKVLEEELTGLRSEVITLKSQRDKAVLEVNFANEKLERFMKDFEHQRTEMNGVISRNVEFSQLIVDYQKKVREASEGLNVSEDLSRKLNMEVSVLKREKEILVNSEKRAFDEVRELSERVQKLQGTLNTVQSTEEVKEEARSVERMREGDYVKRAEREWADAKKELQEERDNVRKMTIEHESAMRTAMNRIEEMGKELSNALRAVADANAKAAAAEERIAKFEKLKAADVNDENAPNEIQTLRDEIEKVKSEAETNKSHMLQYKSIAQVNEAALKQMEESHENFKNEAEKVKKILEDEILVLKEEVSRLQEGYNLKAKEADVAAVSQKEALSNSLSEISKLKEELTVKNLSIESFDSQMLAMKNDLEKEHQKWRTAQDNYERQVILQSETIQELTKTSQVLASLQEEVSGLRKVSDILKIENEELKGKWETEKKVLEEAKEKAEKKYDEINEQNKILHDQLEALHIKMAEKSIGQSGQTSETFDDAGLQNVVKYLRRSKEIAETEISLLKQEKLRLQSQLESAVKGEETAQGLLRAERENSRSVHFTEEEFKTLQLQVREMNLLRESNVQLREENKHNFEECQKLRQSTHSVRAEIENLESLLGEKGNEVEMFKKQMEMYKKEKDELQNKVNELFEKFKDVDVDEYGKMRVETENFKVKLLEKDGNLEEVKKVISEKQEVIVKLEQEVLKSKVELDERDSKLNSISQTETSLKAEVEKQKRFLTMLKRRSEALAKEKEELSKKNLELSKELADSGNAKKSGNDGTSEQANREREEKDTRIQMLEKTVEKLRDESREREEKDTRIQMLEKVVERLREDVRKGKDEVRIEKAKNQKAGDLNEKSKLVDEMEKHKQALKMLLEETEKVNSGESVDELASALVVAVENFEHVANQVSTEFGIPVTTDTPVVEPPAVPQAQNVEESAKQPATSKTKVEPRKVARRLVRPRIVKPEQPKGDADMADTVALNLRKRPSEGQEGAQSHARESTGSDVAAPVVKKSRGSEPPPEVPESVPEETPVNVGEESQSQKEENETEIETGDDEDQTELQNEIGETEAEVATGEVGSEPEDGEMVTDAVVTTSGVTVNNPESEGQMVDRRARSASPMLGEDDVAEDTIGEMEIGSPYEEKNEEGEIEVEETTPEGSMDKVVEGNDEVEGKPEEAVVEKVSSNSVVSEAGGSTSEVKAEEPVAVADTNSSRIISLNERARQRSLQRLAGTNASSTSPPSAGRGRGRQVAPRGRARGGARAGRGAGHTPGSQGM